MAESALDRPPRPDLAPSGATDWSRYRRNWYDDGDDCLSSSFAEALRLTYGEGAPDVPQIEAAYRVWDPDWDDRASTLRLDWYWSALASIGISVEALHQRGDIVAEIRAELDAGHFPCCWIWLWDSVGGGWFHHAVVAVGQSPTTLTFWDPQRGFGWEYDADRFRIPGDGGSSGYAYAATYVPVDVIPEPVIEVTMEPINKSVMLWQYDNCREQTVSEWVATLRLGDIDCFRAKSHDGLTLMGQIYDHPLAPVTLEEIARQYEAFGEHGILYLPWCNPLGKDVPAEAKLAIEVARRCGNRIDVDIEVGARFWNVHNPAIGNRRIPEYFQRIADAGVEIIVDTAMFEGWVEALRLAEIAPLIKRLLSQSYDVGFSQERGRVVDYRELFRHDVAEMRRTGVGEIGIVLDARAGEGIAERAAYAQSLGCVEVSCWAADMATPATYAGFKRVPTLPYVPAEPEPEPAPADNDPIYRDIRASFEEIVAAAQEGIRLSTPGNEGGDTSITDAEAVGGVVNAVRVIQDHGIRAIDLAAQVRT